MWGGILHYLDKNGLAENTIVIYTSDQGAFLGEHGLWDKRLMYEESIRMPFLVRYPGVTKPGAINDNIITNLDFAPTLLDLAGINVPEDIQGQSFKAMFAGDDPQDWPNALYYHYAQPGTPPAHLGIRTDTHKLIYYYGLAGEIKMESGEVLQSEGQPYWELYDIQNDPTEMNNLYDDPNYASTRENLIEQLKTIMEYYDEDIERYKNLVKAGL